MGYLHIKSLQSDPKFLQRHSEVWALEKIHGTSAHIGWKDKQIRFSGGGVKSKYFTPLFNSQKLTQAFIELDYPKVVVYGEAYGGTQQQMSKTYGPQLRFIVFDVFISGQWLNVPDAELIVKKLGLEFVHYERGLNTLEWLNEQRDTPSVQAKRNGILEDKIREGIVIRPIQETFNEQSEREIVKYVRPEFRETCTVREVETDPAKLKILADAKTIANEYVVPMRLEHILQKFEFTNMKDTDKIVHAMIADVRRESFHEVKEWSRPIEKAIGQKTAYLLKKKLQERLER